MTRSQQSSRRVLAVLFLVILGCATYISSNAGSASAASYELRTCQRGVIDPSSSDEGWRGGYANYGAAIPMVADCPNGIEFRTTRNEILGNFSFFEFPFDGYLPIDRMRVNFEAQGPANGIRYTVHACNGCEEIAELTWPAEGHAWSDTFELGGSHKFVVRAECMQFSCPPSGFLRMHSMVADVQDNQAPLMLISGLVGSWTKSEGLKPRLSVYDIGQTGLGEVVARIGTAEPFWAPPTCVNYPANSGINYYAYPFRCEKQFTWNQVLDLRAFGDGQHKLTVNATDAAGNVAKQYTHTYKIDNTAPETPQNVSIPGSEETGWTPRKRIAPEWPLLEAGQTATTSGLRQTWYDFSPRSPGLTDPSPTFNYFPASSGQYFGEVEIPAEGLWDLFVWHVDGAGNIGGKQKVAIGRDADTPPMPALNAPTWLNRGQLIAGSAVAVDQQLPENLESGVCWFSTLHNSTAGSNPLNTRDIDGLLDSIPLPASLPEGESWLHVRSESCAGVMSPTAHVRLRVDDRAPTAQLIGQRPGTWITNKHSLEIRAFDDRSGVERIEHGLDGTTDQMQSGSTAALDPADGTQSVTYRAVDHAGNQSATVTELIKVDTVPPSATFEPRSPDDATLLRGRVNDATSGVGTVEVAIRNKSKPDSAWIWLPVATEPDGTSGGRKLFEARVRDDQLEPGLYEARVTATDIAGHSTTAFDLSSTGVPYEIALPARQKIALSASIALMKLKCKPRTRKGCIGIKACPSNSAKCTNELIADASNARKSRTVGYATRTALVGVLAAADGRAMAGAKVHFYSALPGGLPTYAGSTQTSPSGTYEHRLPIGPNRRITARVDPTPLALGAEATADLGVLAPATLRVQTKRLDSGKLLVFRGALRGLLAERSPKNVDILLQFKVGKHWQPGIRNAVVDGRGRYVTEPYLLKKLAGSKSVLRIRALVRAEGTVWPYQDGFSNTVTVRRPR